MSHRLIRSMSCILLLAASTFCAVAAPPSAKSNPLRISMAAVPGASSDLAAVEITITNTSRHTVRLPRWQLPLGEAEARLFDISVDGREAPYVGRMVKRGLPGPADFAMLRAGESFHTLVDLSQSYDLSATGQYTVAFNAPLQHASLSDGTMLRKSNSVPMTMRSVPLQVWVDGNDRYGANKRDTDNGTSGKPCNPRKQDCGGGGGGGAISFVGCSASQIDTATSAVAAARNYSEVGKGYLGAGTVGPRYTSWFGAYTSSRYNSVQQNFVAIDAAMDQNQGQIKINCGCNQSYYAYVYPTRPYEIFVCRAFWNAPLTGTDSKAGTLIHEMSHFNVVAGTDDHVYGQTGAKNLAATDPARAVDNADNHEYFAENTPHQN
jgi:peptidyl-Lys metalloendopeptidase